MNEPCTTYITMGECNGVWSDRRYPGVSALIIGALIMVVRARRKYIISDPRNRLLSFRMKIHWVYRAHKISLCRNNPDIIAGADKPIPQTVGRAENEDVILTDTG